MYYLVNASYTMNCLVDHPVYSMQAIIMKLLSVFLCKCYTILVYSKLRINNVDFNL